MPNIVKAQNSDHAKIISILAKEIWTSHYTPIIGQDQVEYMLETFHSYDKINSEIVNNTLNYYIAYADNKPLGYCGIKLEDNCIFLSKLYVHNDCRKMGIGKMLFTHAISSFDPVEYIYLTVNKQNINSIVAYEKLGFKICDSVKIDIGNSYFMDDYIMRKNNLWNH